VILNPRSGKTNLVLKLFSYFYNQTSYLIDRKQNDGNFELNPFNTSQINVLGLTSSFRNSLFYNRGKQTHSVTYTYVQNQIKNLLSIGSQESRNSSHQLQYAFVSKKVRLVLQKSSKQQYF
jgi:hypothetical protein